jgi:hydroxylamine reductase (hybrid-cluster protein)
VSPRPPHVQGGDSYAEGFGISILVPKNFRHESFEAEETAKELTVKAAKARAAKAKGEAKDEANKAETKAKKSAAVQQAGAKQKIKEQAATEKAVAAPTKEDAAVKRSCTVSFPGARVVLVIATLFLAASMALQGANSSISAADAAEVVTTKSIFSSANDQQCGLYDNDDSCAVQEAFETTCSVRLSRHLNPHPYT